MVTKKNSVSKKDLESLRATPTPTEKIYGVFLERYRRFWEDAGTGMREHDIVDMWEDFLREMKGVEHIRKFSDLASSVDYLLEKVNQPGWDRVAIRDPGHKDYFILVDRDLAEKAAVLGHLP